MIQKALEYIVGLGKAEIHEENGQKFSDKRLNLLEVPTISPFNVSTLSSLVDYLKSDFDNLGNVIVHVASPTTVNVKSTFNQDANRDFFLQAQAYTPEFRFDSWYDTEDFNIKLQSCFVSNEDRDIMLKVVGNITEDHVKTVSDDGVSQAVVARTGIAKVGNVEVPNPVKLAPYRTFVEVIQPESDFVFRMKNGPRAALFEADGGAWRIEAIENIVGYLHAVLVDEVASKQVTIIA